jgi:hypothetical protein
MISWQARFLNLCLRRAVANIYRHLARILDSQRNALDGGLQRLQQVAIGPAIRAPAPQQVDLQQVEWVDVGVTQTDVALQNALVVEQPVQLFQFEDTNSARITSKKSRYSEPARPA